MSKKSTIPKATPHEFKLGDMVETRYLGDPVCGVITFIDIGETGYSILTTFCGESTLIWRAASEIRLAKEHYLDKFQAAL